MINLKHFESNLLKIGKNSYKNSIYNIGSQQLINPLYLSINHVNRYTEEKNGNKYLLFDDSVDENKELPEWN